MSLQVFGIIYVLIFSGNYSFARPICEDGSEVSQTQVLQASVDRNCELSVGQKQVIDEHETDSPTSLRRRYTVKKLASNRFEILLNLNFIKQDGGGSRSVTASQQNLIKKVDEKSALDFFENSSADEFQKFFQEKVFACLKESAQHMKGPNGETLSFSFTNDMNKAPRNTVRVSASIDRDNSSTYSLYTNCTTVTHEILHLLGLVDEYRETARGYIIDSLTGEPVLGEALGGPLAFDCRAIGPENSIMNNQVRAFEDVKSGKLKSLLTPGQFRIITSPLCAGVNSTYLTCAKNAYATSKANSGKGCLSSNPVCNKVDGSWLK